MVAPKGRAAGGIRILDESKATKKVERDFKALGSDRGRIASLASRDKPPRKPVLADASTKSSAQTGLESGKGMMKNGRKALADIGNLNNGRSKQYTNQLKNEQKILNLKDKSEGAKKATMERSNVSGWHGRFSLARGIMVADVSLMRSTYNLRKVDMTRQISNKNKFKTARNSGNKEAEELGTSDINKNSMVSQELVSHSNGSNHSNDITNKASISGFNSNRRKSYTLSLVIRKGCVGLVKNDLLTNIDDTTNPLEVAEYVDAIYQYYWAMEIERPSLANFMDIQSDITSKMRSVLVNWLIEVHHKYQLMEESLFLMIELLDRLLSIVNIKKNELQLLGLTTLLLASKYEDYWHPKVDELITLSVNQYTKDEMLGMEIFILKNLNFRLNVPTPYVFMLRFLRAAQSDKKLEDLAFYLIELCLVENESLKYKPSMLCASAIFVARSSLKMNPPWTTLLSKHARYEDSQLRSCAEMILRFQKAASCKPVKYTHQKYLKPDRSCVASIKPIKMLPP
ncbi:putative cyclin-B3-1 isoform X2 [Phalaenopsis equestris]|uniref:putative cyclin-B3-1 isoform X2 n=1 Tax=Phalaenopsis equestris TaxID=78828 RepID=UPI0009E3AAC4|nr:putative cyclin-B3-1 isoform X2 [Phalaenopsis equestris]